MPSVAKALAIMAVAGLVAGCAAQGAPSGDPGARPLPAGQSCQTIRAELNRLDGRGAPAKVEAARAGRKLSAQDKADADRYNQLLDWYLGGRCHV